MRNFILRLLDFFYPLVQRFIKKRTYYYIACGGGNTLFGFFLYYISYHFLLHKENLDFGFYAMKPHIAAFFISFLITFPIGFLLSKYIVWQESYLNGKKQLSRHLYLVVLFVFMNYFLLKFFVEYLYWWAMPSQILTTFIIVFCSYLAQKHYSFKH